MEKRIGGILILIEDKDTVPELNSLISQHAEIIIGRQGLPVRSGGIGLISLVVEGTTDQMGALTGGLGRLPGLRVRSVVLKIGD